MNWLTICLLALDVSCTAPVGRHLGTLEEDGAVDATTPDASPVFDMATAWERRTITAGASTGVRRGADGVDVDGFQIVTDWEEGGGVTLAHRPLDPMSATEWTTDQVATGLVGVEDAKFKDVNGDGCADVVSGSDFGARVYVSFGNCDGTYTTVDMVNSHGHNRVMQVAIFDVDQDGDRDIVFGTRFTSSFPTQEAVIGWLENPGLTLSRDGTAWAFHQISRAGWTMSVIASDSGIFVSDRASYKEAGVTKWDLYGSRVLRQVSGVWTNTPISQPAGSCANCTPGDEMFARVVDFDHDGQLDVIDCTSSLGRPNRIVIHRNLGGFAGFTHTVIPDVANVGHCQDVVVADFDNDGDLDIAVSSWKGNVLPVPPSTGDATKSGVWWLRNDGAAGWTRGEISGPRGCKFDNVEIMDVDLDGWPDLVTSEQLGDDCVAGTGAGGLGVVWYRNPGLVAP